MNENLLFYAYQCANHYTGYIKFYFTLYSCLRCQAHREITHVNSKHPKGQLGLMRLPPGFFLRIFSEIAYIRVVGNSTCLKSYTVHYLTIPSP
jgi:hypothetical protein